MLQRLDGKRRVVVVSHLSSIKSIWGLLFIFVWMTFPHPSQPFSVYYLIMS